MHEKQDSKRVEDFDVHEERERDTPRKSTKPQSNLLDWQLEFKKCAELDFRCLQFARLTICSACMWILWRKEFNFQYYDDNNDATMRGNKISPITYLGSWGDD